MVQISHMTPQHQRPCRASFIVEPLQLYIATYTQLHVLVILAFNCKHSQVQCVHTVVHIHILITFLGLGPENHDHDRSQTLNCINPHRG